MFVKVQNSLECKELSAIHFFSPFKNVLKDMTIPIFIQQSFASTTLLFPVCGYHILDKHSVFPCLLKSRGETADS